MPYPWREHKQLAFSMGVSVDEFWSMTPIEFWDFYIGDTNRNFGGPPPEKMTVKKGEALAAEIAKRLNAKRGKS